MTFKRLQSNQYYGIQLKILPACGEKIIILYGVKQILSFCKLYFSRGVRNTAKSLESFSKKKFKIYNSRFANTLVIILKYLV